MNPTAIYSKSGKGVQEASGKTSLLKRPDRAVLSAIDGRATLAEVAQKVGKAFDADFQKLVTQMDKDGFIREVSPGAAPAAAKPAAKAPSKTAAAPAPADPGADLDFSSFAPAAKPAPPPPPRPAAPAAPAAKAPAPKDQTTTLNMAREQAEAKAQVERDRIKAETEAKLRVELEAKARVETEAKMKAEAVSKAKADAEVKVRADAEARRGREEDERARKELEEERKRLEEDRKRREEIERKDEEERAARRKREEEEEKERRRKREEEERKAEEERAARRKREEEEERARQKKKDEERKRREEEERKAEEERAARRKREEEEEERKAEEERAARRKKREEEEALARATEEEERRIRAEEAEAERQRRAAEEEGRRKEEDRRKSEAQKSIAEISAKPAAPAAPAKPAGGFDSLLADLDSFGKKDDEDARAKEDSDRQAKQDAARRAEEAARQEREEEERRAAAERTAQRKREADEEERKAEEERAARRKKREEDDRREEEERKTEEKKRRERDEAEAQKAKGRKAPAKPVDDDIPAGDDDMDDLKRDQRVMAGRKKEKAYVAPPQIAPSTRRRPTNWGKPVAIGLIVLLAVAVGVVHVLPLGTAEYERAASEAIGQPVKIASGRMWLFTGLQLRLQGVTVGDNVRIASVTAYPTFDTLQGDKKTFNRIDLEGVVMPQQALGDALFAKAKGDKFSLARLVAKQIDLTGPLPLPKGLEADISFDAEGAPRTITVRGPDTLVAKLTPKDSTIEFEVNAGGFMIPIAPEVTLGTFGMKGTANRQGMRISEWDGTLLNGSLRGTANVRWGPAWTADGVVTARGINAAVFVPALVSEGRGEGTAKFTMSGPEPAKLGANGRYDGSFKVESGALGSVDLSLALKTGGRQTAGRTPFTDMSGQVTYDRGAASVRNVQIGAGALNAGASADITREGGLSGRIVADVRAGSQTLRATLNIGGTTKDPQFRN